MAIFKGNNGNNKLNGTTGRDLLFGFGGIDTLNGGGGDDKLDGGLGIDSLSGGSGNDTYIIDNTSDKTIELANAGTDLVQSSVSFTLAANIENLTLTGSSAINGTGQLLNNLIIGNDAANKLIGNGGNDILNGKTGIDSLYGGTGDDLLKINEFNGDIIDGGVGKNDALEIFGPDQYFALWDSITFEITGIEKIIFSGGGNNVLELTGSSVLDQSSESNILTVDGDAGDTLYLNGIGWQDGGFQGSYQVFTLGDAVVKASVALGDIVMPDTPISYTISDATTAEQVGSFFTDGTDEVVIDFGGIQYNETGLLYGEMIDLSGFGLEDKLIIASHDGQLHNGTASYASIHYISEYSGSEEFHKSDTVYWLPGSTSASLRSAKKTHQFTPSGAIVYSTTSFTIQLTGLPVGLAESQFVFV